MGFLSGLFGKKNRLYETYHENGQLQFRGIYVAGKPDGAVESYYENGQLKAKSTYMAGELGGPTETCHENGQLRLRGTYDMGVKCGEWFEDGETVTYDPCPPRPRRRQLAPPRGGIQLRLAIQQCFAQGISQF